MKTPNFKKKSISYFLFTAMIASVLSFTSCSSDNEIIFEQTTAAELSNEEKEALLFILEEEKMARDVYTFLYEKWQMPIFINISQSETSHMMAVANILEYYDIPYVLEGYGDYSNETIQSLYNQLTTQGSLSVLDGYIVGATIEDVDIYDLQESLDKTDNSYITSVFQSLQCGSRNHLRAFVEVIEQSNGTYAPQFITVSEYESILSGTNETCN